MNYVNYAFITYRRGGGGSSHNDIGIKGGGGSKIWGVKQVGGGAKMSVYTVHFNMVYIPFAKRHIYPP